jgi:hypothetical protein
MPTMYAWIVISQVLRSLENSQRQVTSTCMGGGTTRSFDLQPLTWSARLSSLYHRLLFHQNLRFKIGSHCVSLPTFWTIQFHKKGLEFLSLEGLFPLSVLRLFAPGRIAAL